MKSVLQDWVQELSFMQQSVLICAIRGEDGKLKHDPAKPIHRYLRRCVLMSAFDGKALWGTHDPGGGSFTGPMPENMNFEQACTWFLDARDGMALHYYMHFTHAVEILGYKHPDALVSARWFNFYSRLVNALHLRGELEADLDDRLSDKREGWLKRTDYSEHTPQDKADLAAMDQPVGQGEHDVIMRAIAGEDDDSEEYHS